MKNQIKKKKLNSKQNWKNILFQSEMWLALNTLKRKYESQSSSFLFSFIVLENGQQTIIHVNIF